jgi:hypothetical protein
MQARPWRPGAWARALRALAAAACALLAGPLAQAGALAYCDPPAALSARQQDRLLRFAAVVRQTLDESGQRLAVVARSGLDLGPFGVRYSHAGLSLLGSAHAPWTVRQLYYACDQRRPMLFDQGLTGFVLGTHDAALGYVSVLLLPEADAAALEAVALDNAQVLRYLGTTYSANAYPFDARYQNCNQWLAELMAAAWAPVGGEAAPRPAAQRWLQAQGFVPHDFQLGLRPLLWLADTVPWLHNDDHPEANQARALYQVAMPSAIDAFVRQRAPGARRLEFCHNATQVVVRQGWLPLADGCVAGPQDQVIALD